MPDRDQLPLSDQAAGDDQAGDCGQPLTDVRNAFRELAYI